MKRFTALFLLQIFCILPILAQTFNGDGYYRVQNFGTKRFIYVTDNTGSYDMNRDQGDFGALQLWKDQSLTISDPASVIYIKSQGGTQYDLRAQGTGIYELVGRYVTVSYVTAGPAKGTYNVYASESGFTKYLSDCEQSAVADGAMGTDRPVPYRNWNVLPINSTGDNYFGISPNVACGEKFYYPFFADFPFSFASTGMKAYVVSQIDTKLQMAVIKEVSGVIPASTPVLIECSSKDATNNRLDLVSTAGTVPATNLLKGNFFCNRKRPSSVDALVSFNNQTMRVLGVTAEGKLGFVSSSENLYTYNNNNYLPANQAYLPVSSGTGAELTIVTEAEYQEALNNIKYTLTYTIDGQVYKTQELKAGEAITPATAPTREGYTFAGWANLPSTMPAQDVTVTGSYTVNSYTITYTIDGQTFHQETVAYGSTISPATAPAREGYTFAGWVNLPSTMPAQDVTVTGSYTVNSYTITYTIDGQMVHQETLAYGSTIISPTAPEREGYTFNGWSNVPENMPAEDVTITGSYTINTYTVTYIVNGEIVHQEAVAYGDAIPEYIYEPEDSRDVFNGWFGDKYDTMPAHDVTYIADITVGINNLRQDTKSGKIYDLSGRPVSKIRKSGIYIQNGKKIYKK